MHLHFTQSLEPLEGAGLGASALGLHSGMVAGGTPSTLVTTCGASRASEEPGVTEYRRSGPAKLFYAPEMGREARQLVEAAQWLHGHGFYVYPNAVLGREARRQGKPLVYHVQGFLDPWILRRSRLKKRIVHQLFENANFRHVSWWRAVSAKEADQIRSCGIRAPIEVIPNGVHLPHPCSAAQRATLLSLYPKKRPRRLLFLSRIHPKKGLDLLIPGWASLGVLRKDWELAIFGPDEGGYQAEIEQLIARHELGDSVTFYGSVSGQAKEAAFLASDLFVLPSYSEGFPMAVLEAASYGLPVIQTDECNFPELTAAGGAWESSPTLDGVTGSLRAALSADPVEHSERGEQGRRLVEGNYAWEAIARQVVEVCEAVRR